MWKPFAFSKSQDGRLETRTLGMSTEQLFTVWKRAPGRKSPHDLQSTFLENSVENWSVDECKETTHDYRKNYCKWLEGAHKGLSILSVTNNPSRKPYTLDRIGWSINN